MPLLYIWRSITYITRHFETFCNVRDILRHFETFCYILQNIYLETCCNCRGILRHFETFCYILQNVYFVTSCNFRGISIIIRFETFVIYYKLNPILFLRCRFSAARSFAPRFLRHSPRKSQQSLHLRGIYIYIYIYICRERERERDDQS